MFKIIQTLANKYDELTPTGKEMAQPVLIIAFIAILFSGLAVPMVLISILI